MTDKQLYKPFKSKAKNKKMSVYVMRDGKKKLIHFGDSSMEDYTQHKDKKRRENYLKRSAGITTKSGIKTAYNKNYANYWSRKWNWGA